MTIWDSIVGWGCVSVALLWLLLAGLLHARAAHRRAQIAAAASAHPCRAPRRAPEDECLRIDCTEAWEVDIHGWKVCRGHDTRRPFDQELTGESVLEAAREITRRAAA